MFWGNYSGKVLSAGILADARADCAFVGRAYQGRGFSCGFAKIENIRGSCIFAQNDKDNIIAEWNCITSATATGVWGSGSKRDRDGMAEVHWYHDQIQTAPI